MFSDYYMWLLDKVDALHGEKSNYSNLLQQLFSTTYVYAFIMDKNRAKGGESLRAVYALEEGLYLEDVYQGPCTVLEMLVGLADTLSFNQGDTVSKWFWEMIDNLGLGSMDDRTYDENYISDVLHTWMNHAYEPDGTGSLFPLKYSDLDQRTMEVWNQMNAYLIENYPIGNWMD